ncbi:hypothetical protein OIU84_012931 [Salix udensis]|uniref:PNPLA domain-containing protein n=1 Tax=Salix udensis TaxID=889485 RepID=A0AAD6JIQ0_9ROSI|nr:hypothetical protein OIU84_012931 [Salix udensis]
MHLISTIRLISYLLASSDSNVYVPVTNDPSTDALLSDICIGISAAPTYLPAHYFETKDPEGKKRDFNLIDGGVAANNPTLVAMSEVSKVINRDSPGFFPIKPTDCERFLVLSLGTGTAKIEQKYDANEAARWGVLGWLTSNNSSPLVDVFAQASSDLDDSLTGTLASVDIATKENLENLVEVGKQLLKKPVSRVNLETGVYEPIDKLTNEEALVKFANILSRQKQLRQASGPLGKDANPK